MKTFIVFRGPSGSGKTTAAKNYIATHGGVYFEADSFFVKDGQYQRITALLGQAHGECMRNIRAAMQQGIDNVIVSNTSITRRDMRPYLDIARQFGYDIKIFRMKGPWDPKVLAARNAHNVPIEGIQRQIDRYQPLENEEEYV